MGFEFSKSVIELLAEKNLKILLVGLDNTGKTTILHQLNIGKIITIMPTIGFVIEELNYKGLSFTSWNLCGADRIRELWKKYYKNINVLMFVIDSNDKERFDDSVDELEFMLKQEELKNCAILIIANKQDLSGALTPEEITIKLKERLKGRQSLVQGTVAKTGQGLKEGLEWILSILEKNK